MIIVYGSSKGHTGRIARLVAETLGESGFSVAVKNVFEARPSELVEYPYVILGSSTYGQGDLQRDFLDFERGMDELDLDGIKAAVFGSGNCRYQYFAEAVDILEAKLRIQGARLLLPSLKQDMMSESPDGESVTAWAKALGDALLADTKSGK